MLIAGLVIGFLGSLHCAGMCNPLVIAVTGATKRFFLSRLMYNLGRVLSYGLQGALVSVFGLLLHLSAWQGSLSIVLGCTFILLGVSSLGYTRIPFLTALVGRFTLFIKRTFSAFLSRRTLTSTLTLGAVNGLLPCGLTYLALSYCLLLPSFAEGFLYMFMFGIGTLPVMLGLTSVLHSFARHFSNSYQKVTTIALIISGVLLLYRAVPDHAQGHAVEANSITICR